MSPSFHSLRCVLVVASDLNAFAGLLFRMPGERHRASVIICFSHHQNRHFPTHIFRPVEQEFVGMPIENLLHRQPSQNIDDAA